MQGGTGGTAPQGGTQSSTFPPSDSRVDIEAFLASDRYTQAPWVSDTSAPRQGGPVTQHDGPVRVWLNPVLVEALKAGRDGRENRDYPNAGSMAVKQLFDDSNALVGIAASLKTADGSAQESWTYYCYGPGHRCAQITAPKESPIYGKGSTQAGTNCGFCHGFSVFTDPP